MLNLRRKETSDLVARYMLELAADQDQKRVGVLCSCVCVFLYVMRIYSLFVCVDSRPRNYNSADGFCCERQEAVCERPEWS